MEKKGKKIISGLIGDEATRFIRRLRGFVRSRRDANLDPGRYPEEIAKQFERVMGKTCDLGSPKTFNEKIQWMKVWGSPPLYGVLADKYEVREYVADRIGSQHLVPLLGVWESPHEIDFSTLPDKFVLKATHGCGWNIIVKDKRKLNQKKAIRQLEQWLSESYAFLYGAFELHYRYCTPRIIAEEYLANMSLGESSSSSDEDLFDYKFWCFGGRVEYIQFLENRAHGLKMAFFDRDWNLMPFVYSYPRNERPVPRPDNLQEMIMLAEALAEGFPHVRVDFYRLDDGRVLFGEMTFTSMSGYCKWDPPEADLEMGRLFDLPAPMFWEDEK